jgi:hypothetical protein
MQRKDCCVNLNGRFEHGADISSDRQLCAKRDLADLIQNVRDVGDTSVLPLDFPVQRVQEYLALGTVLTKRTGLRKFLVEGLVHTQDFDWLGLTHVHERK